MNESFLNVTTGDLMNSNPLINNIIIALVWLFVGLIIGHLVGRLIEKVMKEFQVDKKIKEKIGLRTSVEKLLSSVVSFSIYFVFVIIALNQVGITSLILNIISISVVLVLFISLLLLIKDLIPNLVAYRQISKSVPIDSLIEITSVKGKVLDITFSETQVETKHGDIIHIPNRLFLKESYVQKKVSEEKDTKKLTNF